MVVAAARYSFRRLTYMPSTIAGIVAKNIDLYDENGGFVGKANVGVRIMLADGFYERVRACARKWNATRDCYACGACGAVLYDGRYKLCPYCGGKFEEQL